MPIGGHIVYASGSRADLGPHIFPIEKYEGIYTRLTAEDGLEGVLEPQPAPDGDVLRVHSEAYLSDLERGRHTPRTVASELPMSPAIVAFFRLACGGTMLAARTAFERGWCVHLGGGFHHAFRERAEGFCYLNDLAVAVRAVQAEGLATRVTVVDLDVHQGNGTAAIFNGDATVYTFSMHQEDNYPFKQQSDRDIGLVSFDRSRTPTPWVDDACYLPILERALEEVLDASRPDLVLYQAGADPYERDQLGGFRLTFDGLRRRDEAVFRACRARAVPVAVTLGGGYAAEVADTIAIHVGTVRAAARILD